MSSKALTYTLLACLVAILSGLYMVGSKAQAHDDQMFAWCLKGRWDHYQCVHWRSKQSADALSQLYLNYAMREQRLGID